MKGINRTTQYPSYKILKSLQFILLLSIEVLLMISLLVLLMITLDPSSVLHLANAIAEDFKPREIPELNTWRNMCKRLSQESSEMFLSLHDKRTMQKIYINFWYKY